MGVPSHLTVEMFLSSVTPHYRQVSNLDDSAAFLHPHHPGAHADICIDWS